MTKRQRPGSTAGALDHAPDRIGLVLEEPEETSPRTAGHHGEWAATIGAPAQLARLLACSPTVLYARTIRDGDSSSVWVSDNIERITGHTIEAALTSGWWTEHLHPDDRASAVATSAAMLEHGGSHDYRFRTADGRYRWIRDEQRAVLTTDGCGRVVVGSWSDITERREAEAALHERDVLLRGAFEEAPIGMALTSLDGRWFRVNRAFCEIVGYSMSELLATDFQSITHADDLAMSVELKRRLVAGESGAYTVEKRYIHRAGHVVWVTLSVALVSESPGGVRFLLAQIQDITEHRHAEEALRESEALLRETETIASVGSCAMDLGTHLLQASDELHRIFGLVPRSAPLTAGRVLSMIHLEDRARVESVLTDAVRRGGIFSVEHRIVRPDGVVRTLHCRVRVVVDERGDPSRLIASVQDITEREAAGRALRSSEERFRALIERAADLTALLDTAGVVRFASPSYDRGLGHEVPELLGSSAFALVHPEDLPRAREVFEHVLGSPGRTDSLQVRLRHRDGSWRDFEIVARNFLESAAVGGIILSGRDVTERRALEAQLRQAQKMEAVGQLAGGVAHDFNNLLTVIKVHTELLLEDLGVAHPLRADVSEIRNAASRAASLTRQLLAFSRKQLLQPRRLDVNAVVTDVQKMLARLIGEDIEIVTELPPAVGDVLADPGQLEQVLVNLAVNARDAMPEGGTLTISTSKVRVDDRRMTLHADVQSGPIPPGPYVVLSVIDTGEGMPPEIRERVFEPFFTTKPADRGTGLGLSTVYGIVKQSGGHIALASAPGRGTRFTIYLPHVVDSETATEGARLTPCPRGAETVLLIEDEANVRALARRILERQGYEVLEAGCAREALDLASSADRRIDLVVADMVMPEMSGRALSERLVALRPGLRVLYMSGYTDDEIVRRGLLDAGIRLLHKPFAVDELAHAVRQALDDTATVALSA